jgi:SAM-dependent methyltransferase
MTSETQSATSERGGAGSAGAPAQEPSLNRLAPLTPNAWLRYDMIERMLPPGVVTVLEVGCGQGALGARLSARFDYLGIEPDPESFGVAQGRFAHLPKGEVRQTTIEALGREVLFDLVCAFEVLEHIEDDASALREWASHIKPGGWLMLSVPAHQRRYAAADQHAGHFRRYDPDKLASLAAEIGLEDVEVREYGAPLGYALEFGRNTAHRRELKRMELGDVSMEQRSGASGRLFQPSNPAVAALIQYSTAPFRYMQRALSHGPGVILRAKLPAGQAD